jgi:hypothetical protein
MKKIFLVLASAAIVAACNKEDDGLVVDNEVVAPATGGLVFDISTDEAGNSLTKANVYAQQTGHKVNMVLVHAFKQNSEAENHYLFDTTFVIPGWTQGLNFKRYTIPEANNRTAGRYKFLAVGYNTGDEPTFSTLEPGVTHLDGFAVPHTPIAEGASATSSATGEANELYSGKTDSINVTDDGARVAITITRAVTGVMGYFTNIPDTMKVNGVDKGVATLRLTINKTNKVVDLSTGVAIDAAPDATPYDIVNIDLSAQPVDENGIYQGVQISGVATVPTAQLDGKYLIPIEAVTLTLGLYEADGTAIKEWKIVNGSEETFDLAANQLYSLGRKKLANRTDGGTTNDKTDDDEGIDLMTDQVISVTVSTAWGAINDLTLD